MTLELLLAAINRHFVEKSTEAYYRHGWTEDFDPEDVRLWKAAGIENVAHYGDDGLRRNPRRGGGGAAETIRRPSVG